MNTVALVVGAFVAGLGLGLDVGAIMAEHREFKRQLARRIADIMASPNSIAGGRG